MFGIFWNFLRAKRAGRHLVDETSGPRKAAAERLCFGKKSLPSEDQGVKTGTYLRSKKSNIDGKLPPPHLLDLQEVFSKKKESSLQIICLCKMFSKLQ